MRLHILNRIAFHERGLRDPVAKYVMMIMAMQADEYGVLQGSQEYIGALTGYSDTCIRNKIRLLVDTGFLSADWKTGVGATTYRLKFPVEREGAATWQTI